MNQNDLQISLCPILRHNELFWIPRFNTKCNMNLETIRIKSDILETLWAFWTESKLWGGKMKVSQKKMEPKKVESQLAWLWQWPETSPPPASNLRAPPWFPPEEEPPATAEGSSFPLQWRSLRVMLSGMQMCWIGPCSTTSKSEINPSNINSVTKDSKWSPKILK